LILRLLCHFSLADSTLLPIESQSTYICTYMHVLQKAYVPDYSGQLGPGGPIWSTFVGSTTNVPGSITYTVSVSIDSLSFVYGNSDHSSPKAYALPPDAEHNPLLFSVAWSIDRAARPHMHQVLSGRGVSKTFRHNIYCSNQDVIRTSPGFVQCGFYSAAMRTRAVCSWLFFALLPSSCTARDLLAETLTAFENAVDCASCHALLVPLHALAMLGNSAFVDTIVALCETLKVSIAVPHHPLIDRS
jgi:hypothetical protein